MLSVSLSSCHSFQGTNVFSRTRRKVDSVCVRLSGVFFSPVFSLIVAVSQSSGTGIKELSLHGCRNVPSKSGDC